MTEETVPDPPAAPALRSDNAVFLFFRGIASGGHSEGGGGGTEAQKNVM